MFALGGLASGLDTTSIIQQLMQLERAPVQRYQQQQQSLRSADEAWGKVVTDLSAFRSAVDDVRGQGSLDQFTSVSSSNEDAVRVTASGNGGTGALQFGVEALAAAHRVGTSGSFASGEALVGAGTLTLTDADGNELGTVTTDGSTTLAQLAKQIDDLGVGIDAQVLKVADGDHRLVLNATSTGAASQFTVATDLTAVGTASVVQQGRDAHLKVGTLDVYRSSNTIDDLVDGATLELRATTTSDVTVEASRDTAAAAEAITKVVDSLNKVLANLEKATAYDAETRRAGPLQGDSLARDLQLELRSALGQVSSSGDFTHLGQIGISTTRDGTVELDQAKLTQALDDSFDDVVGMLSQTLTGDSASSVTFVGAEAVPGTFTMQVTQAASVAAITGDPYAAAARSFTITTADGTDVAVALDGTMTVEQAAAAINGALDDAGQTGLRASASGGALQLATTRYGSSATFTVTGYGADLDGTHAGADVQADFGNGVVTGSGRTISGDGAAAGLTLSVPDGVGTYTMTYADGLGGTLDRLLDRVSGSDGSIQRARDALTGRVTDIDDQIEAFEQRLEIRERTLRAKFSSLESTLGTLQSQGQWLQGQLAGLQ